MPKSMTPNRFKFSILFNLFLLCLCIGLFFYGRHADENLDQSQQQIRRAQFNGCLRDNHLRKDRNAETRVIKAIMNQIVANSKKRAAIAKKQGNMAEYRLSTAAAAQYQAYNDELHYAELNNCVALLAARTRRDNADD